MNKLETIVEVHQLKKQGFRVAAIARKCNLKRLKGNGEKFMSLPLCSLIRDLSMRNGRNILLLHVMCCVLMRTPLSFMEEEQKRSFMIRIS